MTMKDVRSLNQVRWLRAATAPAARAYTYLADGEREADERTYAQLDRRTRSIARLLRRWRLGGERALLLYPTGVDFIEAFLACLEAGVVAVPSYPPHPSRPERGAERLQAIVDDARPAVVLTTAALLAQAPAIAAAVPGLAGARWLGSDAVAPDDDVQQTEDVADIAGSDTLAFLQYTSGSTASPRGVMVTHGNLLHNLACAQFVEDNDADSVSVSWLPMYHDMGLIEGILAPLHGGYPAYLMAPAAFLQRPVRWLEAISRYRGTNSGGPNFAYDLCVRRVSAEQRSSLDLTSWRVAYDGAEPVQIDTLRRFHAAFAGAGFSWSAFSPVYGLAESTLVVTGDRRPTAPVTHTVDAVGLERDAVMGATAGQRSAELVACGRPVPGTEVRIVDPKRRRPCAAGVLGEIWLRGPSVAAGYWGRDAATEAVFGGRLSDGEGPFLRTGDLGYLTEHGQLVVTGRRKDLIIVRGRKHYPQDLERTLDHELSPPLRRGCVAAVAVTRAGHEGVGVIAELDPRAERDVLGTVAERIRAAIIGGHEIEPRAIALVAPGSVLKTTSGKLRRRACRDRWLQGGLETLYGWEAS